MKPIELDKQLKDNKLDSVYLFIGEEDYIKDAFIQRIISLALSDDTAKLNYHHIDNQISKNELLEVVENVPLMFNKKVVFLDNLGIIKGSAKSDLKDELERIINDIPPYTVIIIKEKQDEKSKIQKNFLDQIKKKGSVIDCKYLEQSDMMAFANREISKYDKKIRKDDLEYLIMRCGSSINSVMREIEKLCSYANDAKIISKAYIDRLVSNTVEYKLYELTDAVIKHNKQKAYLMINELKTLNQYTSATTSLAQISKYIWSMYTVKINKNANDAEISSLLNTNVHPYTLKLYKSNSQKFSEEELASIIKKCAKIDLGIKTGKINPNVSIEKLIAEF